MKEAVLKRIQKLGGNTSGVKAGDPLLDQLAAIKFSQVLFDDAWEGLAIEEFRDNNPELLKRDRDAFIEATIDHLLENNEQPRGQCFWRSVHFTPLTKGTEDFKEWNEIFCDLELAEIREVAGDGELEFVQIIESYGWPDHYYICLADPDPENPTVFGTDHEAFFDEIIVEGTLEEFFNKMLDRQQLQEVVLINL